MPFSYAQYAGNGSTTTFSVPFPYLLKAHVKLYTGFNILNGTFTTQLVEGTDYAWTSATQVQTTVAPANGVTLTVLRDTPDSSQLVPWQDGSNLVAEDLNNADLQNLYVVQEQQDRNDAGITQSTTAITTANSAVTTANAAVATANTALSTANTALSNANAAVSTANTASANASAAVTTANAATATANTAATNASTAVATANTASTNASTAVTTANNADVKADAAIAAVASSVNYTGVANVAAIPGSPANNTYIEVLDATGLESFSPLAGMPVGFVGDSGLRARLRYTTAGSTWNWIDYAPTNPDARYVNETAISSSVTSTSATTVASSAAVKTAKDAADSAGSAASAAQSTANTAVSDAAAAQSAANAAQSTANTANTTANAALPKAGGTMTGAITFAGGQTFPGAVTSVSGSAPVSVTGGTTPTVSVSAASTSASGVVQLSDSTSSSSSSTAATSAAVKSVQDFAQVVSTTANAAMPKAGGTFTGDVAFNTTTATTLPAGTTAQRPTGATGMVRFNSSLVQFEGYNGTSWGTIGGGAKGGGSDQVFFENDQSVTTNYTLSAGKNAVTAGPCTVASGVTVTIPSGASWVIV